MTDLVNIALLGSTTLQPQYQSLKTKVQEWLDNGTLPQNFTVTGHSLGGFLATGLTTDFPGNVSHAYLYNTPGVGGILGDLINMMQNAWGVPTQYDPAKFSNVEAVVSDGFSICPEAGLGYVVTPPISIMIEDQLGDVASSKDSLSHSTKILTATQAVQQPSFPYSSERQQSGKALYGCKNPRFSVKINSYFKKLFFGVILAFFINQNAFCEKYNVNPAINEDFIAWSNSMPKEKAANQLKDFLSSFDSWEEAKAWLVIKGFKIDGPLLLKEDTLNTAYGISQSPLFSVSAAWGTDRQGIIFAHNWLLKLESRIFVYGVSVGLLYSEHPFAVHRVHIVETRL
ncbi:MAG: hypothetical protein H6936_03140 [Burkholderiales bacterium]|nr:hypothetical protein [Burkholderiales bacterium]